MTRTELKWILRLAIRKAQEIEEDDVSEEAYTERRTICADTSMWPGELATVAQKALEQLGQPARPGVIQQIFLRPDGPWGFDNT